MPEGQTTKEKDITYRPDRNGKYPCPGGFCSHPKCIVEYESRFNPGKRYRLQ